METLTTLSEALCAGGVVSYVFCQKSLSGDTINLQVEVNVGSEIFGFEGSEVDRLETEIIELAKTHCATLDDELILPAETGLAD